MALPVLILILFSNFVLSQTIHPELDSNKNIQKVIFGSCNNQNDSQPLWKTMIESRADLFIWLGDAIYADWKSSEDIKLAYDILLKNKDYVEFQKRTPIIGTWDDHDFGFDNADGNLSDKKISQSLFLDFLGVDPKSPRRLQDGIYYSYDLGVDERKIKIILLDNRYFKGLESTAPLLGEEQWIWLENELRTSTAGLNIIAAGLPIFSPLIPFTEEWAQYPQELSRMLDLMNKYNVKAPFFLAGDKHFSSIYQRHGHLEFMSSGMTHVANRRTWWYLGRKYPYTFFGLNFGMLEISWDGVDPIISLSIRDRKNRPIHPQTYKWENNNWKRIYL